jgi:hypothetical protein
MPDRSCDRPTGNDDEIWFLRRDNLVAGPRAAPRPSRELLGFADTSPPSSTGQTSKARSRGSNGEVDLPEAEQDPPVEPVVG